MKGMCFCTILERLCPVLSIQYLNNKKYISIYVSWIKKKNIKERFLTYPNIFIALRSVSGNCCQYHVDSNFLYIFFLLPVLISNPILNSVNLSGLKPIWVVVITKLWLQKILIWKNWRNFSLNVKMGILF